MGLPALQFSSTFPWISISPRPDLKIVSDTPVEVEPVLEANDLAVTFNTVSLGINGLPNVTDVSLKLPMLEPEKFWNSLESVISNLPSIQEKFSSKIELKVDNDFANLSVPLTIDLKEHNGNRFFNLYSEKYEVNIFFNPNKKTGAIYCGNMLALIDSNLSLYDIQGCAKSDPDILINEYYDAFLSVLKQIGFDGINR